MKKILSNVVYQSLFQIVKIIIPLITIPIVSKALGPENVGIFKYSNSIVSYFALIAGMGTTLYGQRQIAMHRSSKQKMSEVFWSIEMLSVFVSILIFIIYFLVCLILNWNLIYIIQSLTIIAVMFDISWLFMGLEDFKLPSIRSTIVSLTSLMLIIFFVNSKDDLYVYVFITVVSTLLSQLCMWPFLKNRVKFVKISLKMVFNHFKGTIELFFPTIAITFYTNLNITVLGFFSTSENVAFYSNAILFTTIITSLISTLDTVMLPQISFRLTKESKESILETLKITLNLPFYFTIPAYFGLCLISPKMIPWFLGDNFKFVIYLIPITSLLIIIKPIGMGISRQYLISSGRIKEYSRSLLYGAIVGLILNVILVPIFDIWGSVFTIITAETIIVISRLVPFIKETSFKYNIKFIFIYFLCSIFMYVITFFMTFNLSESILTTAIQIMLALGIYLFLTIIMKVSPINSLLKKK